MPTILVWTSFVMLLFAATGNRYTTYGLALAVMALTGWLQMRGKMNWVGNWDLWGVLRWSDLGTFELDRTALVLNRVAALGLAVLFVALTVRVFPRRDRDATRTVHRLAPGAIARERAADAPLRRGPARGADRALGHGRPRLPGQGGGEAGARTTGSRTSPPGRTRRSRR